MLISLGEDYIPISALHWTNCCKRTAAYNLIVGAHFAHLKLYHVLYKAVKITGSTYLKDFVGSCFQSDLGGVPGRLQGAVNWESEEKSQWAWDRALATRSDCVVGTALGAWDARVSVAHVHLCVAALAIALYILFWRNFHFNSEKIPTSMVCGRRVRGCNGFGFKSSGTGKQDYHLHPEVSSMNWSK